MQAPTDGQRDVPSPPWPLLVRAWLPVALAASGMVASVGGDAGVLAVASLGVGAFLLLPVWAGLAASARRAAELGAPFERCYEAPGAEVTLEVGRHAALALCRRATSAAARSMALADGPDVVRAASPSTLRGASRSGCGWSRWRPAAPG